MESSGTTGADSYMHTLPYLFLISVSCIVYQVYVNFIRPLSFFKKLGINGPSPRLVVGNVLDKGGLHNVLLRNRRQYGKIYGTFIGTKPVLWVGDPEILKQIMVKDFANFTDRVALTPNVTYPGNYSVIYTTGETWKRIRRVLIPTFTAAKLKQVIPIINNACDGVVQELSIAGKTNKIVNVQDIFKKLVMEIVLGTAFGVQPDTDARSSELIKASRKILDSVPVVRLIGAIMPLLYPLAKLLCRDRARAINYVAKTVKEVVRERRDYIKKGIKCNRDLLQLMIEATENGILNDEEIIGQAYIFLVAGYEATASTLSFASYLLASNPKVQQKLIAEIDEKYPDPKSLDYDSLINLPYLDMVVNETLRLYPPGFIVNRKVTENTTINGIRIPKDVILGIPIYSIHHDPDYWPNPEEFDPQRFTTEAKSSRQSFCHLPFGAGPRNCIGMRLALIEVKIALIKALQNVEFVVSEKTAVPLKLKSGATLSPAEDVLLGVKGRH